jgi:aminomethyltransferase
LENSVTRKTALYEEHAKLGAQFTDFGGWEMPVRYTSDLAEHHAVRNEAGLFDISHMAEFFVTGVDSANFLNFALVGRASEIQNGRAKYSLICNQTGGIIDDLIVYRLADEDFLVIANAGNREAVAEALKARTAGFDVELRDESDNFGLLAVQGPRAVEILQKLTDTQLSELKYYSIDAGRLADVDVFFARTGYTGEDGFELLVRAEHSANVWNAVLAAGESYGLVPAGLACRDTLRLEAGMPLYGHELGLDTNPFEAGFARVVRLDREEDFVGKAALAELANVAPSRKLVGLAGEGKRAARAEYPIFVEESEIGAITSGALSPTLGYPVAMAYVSAEHASEGSVVSVDIRGTRTDFTVVKLPFYKRTK